MYIIGLQLLYHPVLTNSTQLIVRSAVSTTIYQFRHLLNRTSRKMLSSVSITVFTDHTLVTIANRSGQNLGSLAGALALLQYAKGQDIMLPGEGNVLACGENGCAGHTCGPEFGLGTGYPNCVIYESGEVFAGYGFEADVDGYDVWWNSNEMDEGCRVIVRTPATVDVQNCGFYLTGWHNKGCYKTHLRNSFMLQFCCGTGDCDAAEPSVSTAQARVRALQGRTASTSLGSFASLKGTGKRDLGEGITMEWAPREPSSPSQLAKRKLQYENGLAENEIARERTANMSPKSPPRRSLAKRSCSSYTEIEQYTERGEQRRVSDNQQCAGDDICTVIIQTSVTEGSSMSAGASATLFEVVSLETSIEFSESTTSSISRSLSY